MTRDTPPLPEDMCAILDGAIEYSNRQRYQSMTQAERASEVVTITSSPTKPSQSHSVSAIDSVSPEDIPYVTVASSTTRTIPADPATLPCLEDSVSSQHHLKKTPMLDRLLQRYKQGSATKSKRQLPWWGNKLLATASYRSLQDRLKQARLNQNQLIGVKKTNTPTLQAEERLAAILKVIRGKRMSWQQAAVVMWVSLGLIIGLNLLAINRYGQQTYHVELISPQWLDSKIGSVLHTTALVSRGAETTFPLIGARLPVEPTQTETKATLKMPMKESSPPAVMLAAGSDATQTVLPAQVAQSEDEQGATALSKTDKQNTEAATIKDAYAAETDRMPDQMASVAATANMDKSGSSGQVVDSPINNMPPTHLMLTSEDWVFFAGDSMMQGVAPWVSRELQQDYGIKSIDLSKQNTGLSYSNFFDWPATVEQTLQDNPKIAAMVMYLGANDPWAVPNPDKPGGTYIKFASPQWEQLYTDKIIRIITAAKQHHVQILWLTPPAMKKPKLNEQMQYLETVYQNSPLSQEAILLDTRTLLSSPDHPKAFVSSLTIDQKPVKIRTGDGIHFTPSGQKRIAAAIIERIQVQSSSPTSTETQ